MSNRGDEMSHISFENLIDFVDGRLDAATSKQIEEHLTGECESCESDLSWLQETLSLMRSDDWVAPPANLNTTLVSAFQKQIATIEPKPKLIEKIAAFFAPRPQLAWGAAAVLILIVFFVAFSIGGRAAGKEVTAVAAVGTVEVRTQESGEWAAVEVDSTYSAGDALRTGENSTVVLTYEDGSTTIIEANSEVHIMEMSSGRNGQVTILAQMVGRSRHDVDELQGNDSLFEVRTPSASVTVLGTIFTVDVDQEGNSIVWVGEGMVAVSAGGQTAWLMTGESTYVQVGGVPATATATASPTPTETATAEEQGLFATPEDRPDTPTPDSYLPPTSPTSTQTASPEPTESSTPSPTPTDTPTSTPTETAMPSTATPVPPTATPVPPTPRPAPPTSTPRPPTPVPPNPTPVPPTSTPVPPTNTPIPPPPTVTNTPVGPPYP